METCCVRWLVQYRRHLSSPSSASSRSSPESRDSSLDVDFWFTETSGATSCQYTTHVDQLAPATYTRLPSSELSDDAPPSYAAIRGVIATPGQNTSNDDGYQCYVSFISQ